MALRLIEIEDPRTGSQFGPDSWLPAYRTASIPSTAATVIKRELWRYLRREVEGRSFLLAGHRGAGKTTTLNRAVADVLDDVLKAATSGAPMGAGQRPLLVKLHGPSLFSAAATLPTAGETTTAAKNETPKLADTAKTDADPERTRAALVQVMTALYRALASETAERFRIHAAERTKPGTDTGADWFELAAQLQLELDKAPMPETLRWFWNRLGRLRGGVLWPAQAIGLPPDQGMREVVALATAAQAFQVCSGSISYESTRKESSSQEQKREVTAKPAISHESVDKLFGLAGGAAVAGGVAASGASAAAAALAGVVSGVLGAVAFSWSSTRSRKRDDATDYKFIRDFSLATLDRDLPEVIRRIRRAGLAPVFVVDELDKLGKADVYLETLIDRLKNLTTDYGFFCFLTDRAYFEGLRSRLRSAAYPREYTFFSNLLFVRHDGEDMLRYMLSVVGQEDPARAASPSPVPEPSRSQDALAWLILAYSARHRSRLSTIDLVRELAATFDHEGWLREPSSALAGRRTARLQAAVQMAVDLGLKQPRLAAEIEEGGPAFAQVAVDALYMLSNAWTDGQGSVQITPKTLTDHLKTRSDASGSSPPASFATTLTKGQLSALMEAAIHAAELLTNFATLGTAARTVWLRNHVRLVPMQFATLFSDESRTPFDEIIGVDLAPRRGLGLVKKVGDHEYRFLIDSAGGLIDTEVEDTPQETIAAAQALLDALESLGASLPALIEAGALSSSVDAATIRAALDQLGAGENILASGELSSVDGFLTSCVQSRHELTWTLQVACLLTPPGAPVDRALLGLARHVKAGEIAERLTPFREDPSSTPSLSWLLSGTVEDVPETFQLAPRFDRTLGSIEPWATALRQARDRPLDLIHDTSPWDRWIRPIAATLDAPGAAPSPVSWWDLAGAAQGTSPGALVRRRVAEMTVIEWSALALASFPQGSGIRLDALPWAKDWSGQIGYAPPDIFVAALRMLGYRRDVVIQAPADTAVAQAVRVGGSLASPDDVNVLWLYDGRGLAAEPPTQRNGGILAVPLAALGAAAALIGWLKRINAIDAVIVEED